MIVHKTPDTFLLNTVTNTKTGCMEWQHGKSKDSYGRFLLDGVITMAHRHAYTLAKGPIPDGMLVRHMCHNPACCNADHLEVGTQKDNMADMVAAGRSKSEKRKRSKPNGFGDVISKAMKDTWEKRKASGQHNVTRKLNEMCVIAIRYLAANGKSKKELAEAYNVTHQAINAIVKRKAWNHVL